MDEPLEPGGLHSQFVSAGFELGHREASRRAGRCHPRFAGVRVGEFDIGARDDCPAGIGNESRQAGEADLSFSNPR